LVDLVLDSSPEPYEEALEMKARLLEALANSEESFIARNIFTSSSSRLARGG